MTARTDSAGRFRIAVKSASTHLVRVEALGLAARTLPRVRPGESLRIALDKGGSIEGIVRDGTTGAPAAGITVEARLESRAWAGHRLGARGGRRAREDGRAGPIPARGTRPRPAHPGRAGSGRGRAETRGRAGQAHRAVPLPRWWARRQRARTRRGRDCGSGRRRRERDPVRTAEHQRRRGHGRPRPLRVRRDRCGALPRRRAPPRFRARLDDGRRRARRRRLRGPRPSPRPRPSSGASWVPRIVPPRAASPSRRRTEPLLPCRSRPRWLRTRAPMAGSASRRCRRAATSSPPSLPDTARSGRRSWWAAARPRPTWATSRSRRAW